MTAGGAVPLRGAVVGCGYFAQNHLHAWRELDGAEIVAVCDLDGERARETAARHGIPRAYTDFSELLAHERLDFVDLCTQVHTHLPLVRQVAGRVAGVICQKPFALSLDEGREMVRLCEASSTRLLIHENFRFQPALRRARQLSGEVGRLFYGRIHFRSGYDVYAGQPYLRSDERFILMDLGVHLFDLARFYFGEARSVSCHTGRINPGIRGEDVATALVVSRGNASCVVEMSYASQLDHESFPQTYLHLEGERGSVTVGRDYHLTLVTRSESSEARAVRHESVPPQQHSWSTWPGDNVQDSVLELQRHFLETWRQGRNGETCGADNLHTLALTFAAYESAESGRTVDL